MITRIAEERKLGKRIVRGYPILEAEVVYAGVYSYSMCVVGGAVGAEERKLGSHIVGACQKIHSVHIMCLKQAFTPNPPHPTTTPCPVRNEHCETPEDFLATYSTHTMCLNQ